MKRSWPQSAPERTTCGTRWPSSARSTRGHVSSSASRRARSRRERRGALRDDARELRSQLIRWRPLHLDVGERVVDVADEPVRLGRRSIDAAKRLVELDGVLTHVLLEAVQ